MADPSYIDSDGVLLDGEAWIGLGHQALSSNASTVTFTSSNDGQVTDWSQYLDLILISYARSVANVVTGQFNMQLNNDTGNNYYMQNIYGTGSNAYAQVPYAKNKFYLGDIPGANATANVYGAYVTHIYDINSGKFKSLLAQQALDLETHTSGKVRLSSGVWTSQDPITEIDLSDALGPGDIASGSTFSLFGVLPRMVA
jgi:hypothetical protein